MRETNSMRRKGPDRLCGRDAASMENARMDQDVADLTVEWFPCPKPTECRMRNNFRDERGDGDRMIEVEGNVPSLSDKSVPVQPMKLSDSNRQYILLTW